MPAAVVRKAGRRLACKQPHRLEPIERWSIARVNAAASLIAPPPGVLRRILVRDVEKDLLVWPELRAVVRMRRGQQELLA